MSDYYSSHLLCIIETAAVCVGYVLEVGKLFAILNSVIEQWCCVVYLLSIPPGEKINQFLTEPAS